MICTCKKSGSSSPVIWYIHLSYAPACASFNFFQVLGKMPLLLAGNITTGQNPSSKDPLPIWKGSTLKWTRLIHNIHIYIYIHRLIDCTLWIHPHHPIQYFMQQFREHPKTPLVGTDGAVYKLTMETTISAVASWLDTPWVRDEFL